MTLRSTRYSEIAPSTTTAEDFTTSISRMLRTVRAAVATACRAASLQDTGDVPTTSRTMKTPIFDDLQGGTRTAWRSLRRPRLSARSGRA